MAKFVYPMQSILQIKIKLEDQARNELAQVTLKLREEQEKLEALRERLAFYCKQAVELRSEILNPLAMKENENAQRFMKEQITQQLGRVRAAEKEVEKARAHLQELMIDRKTHEKLREAAFENFKIEVAAEENKEVDELVSYVYGKKAGM